MTRSNLRPTPVRRFNLKPMSLALAMSSLSSPLWAGVFTGVQSTQNVNISEAGKLTTVNQSAQVGVIKTQGFGIGVGEALKAIQPNSNATLWIDVTGAARSDVLGALTANGRVLISNPYGIYFGAGAQINVGSLVATTLGVNGDDLYKKGRIRLKDNGQSVGSVVNAGVINATGTVVLAGATVINEGIINAARVGMAATSDVQVDVEGDGLIFFEMSGAKAGQRLSQIGQITADGGTVDLRADARGAMADTVLNMEGMVRARSIGSRNGQVFIDGGEQGRTLVTGQIDVSGQGAGEHGGQATVLGQKVELASSASIDARGQAGGGTILVGGNYQGTGTERHATTNVVHAGATLDASAIQAGNGGQVVVWADDLTLFSGNILVRGGEEGGNGGNAEVSGKLRLGFDGWVDGRAPKGLVGNLLLDPRDIKIEAGGTVSLLDAFLADSNTDVIVDVESINNALLSVTLTASRNIFVNDDISMKTSGANLTLTANSTNAKITLNANIATKNSTGDITLNATGANGNIILSGDPSAASTVKLTGDNVSLNANIQGDGIQNRSLDIVANTDVSLGKASNVVGSSTAIGNLTIKTSSLEIKSDGIKTISDSAASISTTSETGDIRIKTSTASDGSLVLTPNTIDKLNNFKTVKIGSTGTTTNLNTQTWNVATPDLPITGRSINLIGLAKLERDVTIDSPSSKFVFDGQVSSKAGNSFALSVENATSVTFNGAVSGLTSLNTSTSNATNINASITTTGTQSYSNVVTLGGSTPLTLKGTEISFVNLDAVNRSLVLQTNAINITGAITNPGASLGVTTLAGTGTIGLAGATGTLAIDSATLAKLDDFTALNIGTGGSTGTNITSGSNALSLGANTTLLGNNITLAAVTGNTHSLTLTGAGATLLNGSIADVTNLLVNGGGTTTLAADITTTGSQTYEDALTLGSGSGTRKLTASSIDIKAGITAINQNLSLRADALSIAGTVTSGTGIQVFVATSTDGLSIGVGTGAAGGPGSLQLSDTTRNALGGFKAVTIGRAGSDSAIDVTSLQTLGVDLTLIANAADITLSSVTGVGAGVDLKLTSSTGVTLGGVINGLNSLNSDGTGGVNVNANVSTTGSQSYTGNVTLGGTGTRSFSGSALSFAGINANSRALALNTLSLSISGAVSNPGSQATLTTLNGTGSIGLAGAAGDLALSAPTLSKFDGFGTLVIGGGNVNIAANDLTLGTNTTLSSGSGTITLAAVTGNNKALTLTGSGLTKVGGAIGGVSDLLINGGGSTELNADVTTNTSIVVNDAIASLGTGGTRSLRSDSINLQGNITAASQSLNLRADTLTVAGTSTANAGTSVTLSTNTDGRSIGLAGAAGSTSITQATLNALNGFKALNIGRASSNSAITAGTTNYTGGDLSFTSGTESISLTGTGVTTANGSQTYNGTVNLSGPGTGNHTFSAKALTFQKNVQANSHNVTLKADAFTFGTGAGITGNNAANQTINIAAQTAGTTIGISGGSGALQLPLGAINGFKALALGDATGTGKITVGGATPSDFKALSFTTGSGDIDVNAALGSNGASLDSLSVASTSGTIRLNGVEVFAKDASFTGKTELSKASGSDNVFHGNTLAFNGTVDSAVASPAVLDASDVGTTRFTGVVGGTQALSSLSTRNVEIGGDITANTSVSLAGNVSLLADSSITASSITMGGPGASLNGSSSGVKRDLTLVSDNLPTFQLSSVTGGGNLTLAPLTATRNIKIGDVAATDTLMISASTLQAFSSFEQITVGSTTGSGTITVGDANGSLSLSKALNINGTARIAASSVSTALGSQTYERSVTLDSSTTLTATSLRIKGLVDGQAAGGQSLTINTTGNTRLDAAVGATTALGSVAITAGSLSLNGGSVTTANAQTYTAPITLGSDTSLTSTRGKVTLADTVQGTASGAQALSVSGTQVEFKQDLGTTANRLKSLTVNGPLTLAGAQVFTTGAQQYLNNVTLKANATLSANDNIVFNGLVDGDASGSQTLTVNSSGITRFVGAVGSTQALTGLITDNVGSTELGGHVTTSGAQSYGDAVTLIGATGTRNFTASALNFGAGMAVGARSLNLKTDGFTFNGTLTVGSGQTATLSTLNDGVSIGLAGGAGTLNISQGELDQFGGFDSLTVGRSNSASIFTAGALTLPTSLTLINSNANITLAAVSGAIHNLTVLSAGTTAWGGNVIGVTNLSTDAGGSNTVSANIATTGSQTWGDAVTLSGTGTRLFEAPTLVFQSALSAGNTSNIKLSANSLSLSSAIAVSGSNQTAQVDAFTPGTSIGLAGAPGTLALSQTAIDQFAGFSQLTIGGSNTGSITALALRLPTKTVLSTNGNVILSAVNGAGFDLSIEGANTTLSGAITAVRNLSTDSLGTTQINADISTTGSQTYGDDVTLGGTGTRTLTGTAITLSKTLDVAQHDLSLNTNALAFNGDISGASGKQVSISTFTGGGTIELVTATPGSSLSLSQATLNRLAPFALLTVGGGNNAITASSALTLSTHTTLNAGLAVVNLGAVNGAGFDLAINSGATTTLGGAIQGVRQLSTDAAGSTVINASLVDTTSSQTFRDALSLGADVTFKAPELIISGPTLSVGTHGLSLIIDTLTLGTTASASGGKPLSIVTFSDGRNIVMGTSAGTASDLVLSNATLAQFAGFGSLTVGSDTSTSSISATGLSLPTQTTLVSATGQIAVNGVTGNGKSLRIDSDGAKQLQGGLTGLSSLATQGSGRTLLSGATLTTTGTQTFSDNVEVSGSTVLTSTANANIQFAQAINGQSNGTGSLSINTGGVTQLQGNVGSTRALASLSTDAAGSTQLPASVNATGLVSLLDQATLTNDLVITHGGLTFGSAIDSAANQAFSLGLISAANTNFNASVGSVRALSSVTATGGGNMVLGSNASGVITTGAQSYSGDVQFTGNAKLIKASSLTVGKRITGANGLSLIADSLNIGAALAANATNLITGSGTLLIQPLNMGTTIGIGDGATGLLKITQGMIGTAPGFSALTVGDANGSGDINVGTTVLSTHTTIQSRTGDININGSVDSASTGNFDLLLNTGRITSVQGAVGANRAVRNFITDDQADTANAATGFGERVEFGPGSTGIIKATESIVLNETVSSSVGTRWVAGTQVQATANNNAIDGAINIEAANLQLNNGLNLTTLGDIHLTGNSANKTDSNSTSNIVANGLLALNGDVRLASAPCCSNPTPSQTRWTPSATRCMPARSSRWV
jgi:filamentous hemagglutinin family protein